MQVVSIKYEKTINLGDYQSEKIGLEIALDSMDKPGEALQRAKQFVAAGSSVNGR